MHVKAFRTENFFVGVADSNKNVEKAAVLNRILFFYYFYRAFYFFLKMTRN